MPVPSSKFWERTSMETLVPPIPKNPPGRPKKSRNKEEGEQKRGYRRPPRVMTCQLCGKQNHNTRGCPTRKLRTMVRTEDEEGGIDEQHMSEQCSRPKDYTSIVPTGTQSKLESPSQTSHLPTPAKLPTTSIAKRQQQASHLPTPAKLPTTSTAKRQQQHRADMGEPQQGMRKRRRKSERIKEAHFKRKKFDGPLFIQLEESDDENEGGGSTTQKSRAMK